MRIALNQFNEKNDLEEEEEIKWNIDRGLIQVNVKQFLKAE